MSKILPKLFPFFDFLYIFQVLEYNIGDFFVWSTRNLFKRNLQKKHKLDLTRKVRLLVVVGLLLAYFVSVLLSEQLLAANTIFIFLLFILLFSPLFIILAQILLLPLEAYQKNKIISLAKTKLNRLDNLKVIAITGSFGKTSTKDILYTLLWKKYKVVKTIRSYNNPLSLAQTILDFIKPNTEIFIAEVGAYKRGEIKKIGKWLKPDISVITAVAPQHLEKFGSLENIAKAKFELVESLDKNGLAVLNKESDLLVELSKTSQSKIIYFNGEENFVSNIKVSDTETTFKLNIRGESVEIAIPLIGQHHAKNFLIAAIVATQLGLSLKEIKERSKLLLPTPHRLEIKRQGNITIIDNSYNTNPQSTHSSIKLLADLPGQQKIMVTPGLVELGRESEKENIQFAKNFAAVATEVIIVGDFAKKFLTEGLKKANFAKDKIYFSKSTEEALNLATQLAKLETAILVENDLPDQYF